MQIRHLEYFLEINKAASITDAAKNLYISQPSLSNSIKSLENELGYELFIRTKNGIILTEQGKEILPDVIEVITKVNQWKSLPMTKHFDSLFGSLKIKAQFILSNLLTDSIIKFMSHAKHCNIEICEIRNLSLTTPPSTTHPEIIICFLEEEKLHMELANAEKLGWKTKILQKRQCNFYVNVKDPIASLPVAHISDLVDHKLILSSNKEELNNTKTQNLIKYFEESNILVLPNVNSTLKTIANDSNYVSLLTDYATRYYSSLIEGNIVPITLVDFPLDIFVVVFFPENTLYQSLIQNIMKLIEEEFIK